MNVLELRRRTLGKGVYKKTVEGNPAIAQGSLARRYPGITMQGWTEQDSTTGAQLFDASAVKNGFVSAAKIGEKFSFDANQQYPNAQYVEVPVTQYVVSYDFSKNIKYEYDIHLRFSDDNGICTNGTVTGDVKNGTAFDAKTTKIYVIALNGFINIDTLGMMNYGKTLIPYEPYTGGAPSPSPDYPQEIKNAGKYGEASQKWKYEVKLIGANIFLYDKDFSVYTKSDKFFDKFVLSDYKVEAEVNSQFTTLKSPVLTLKPNTKYTVSAVLSSSSANRSSGMIRLFKNLNVSDSQKTLCTVQRPSNPTLNEEYEASVTFTTNDMSDTPECYLQCDCSWNETEFPVKSTFKNIMITEVEGADYEPYHTPQTVTLTSDRPITKWDKLEKRNGVWGWVYKSGKKVIDGTETYFVGGSEYISGKSSNAYINNNDMVKGIPGLKNGYCNRLTHVNIVWGTVDSIGFCYNNNQIHMRISNDSLGTTSESTPQEVISAMKAYMSQKYNDGNPFIFWYETAEETFIPLSESEQEQMNELYTFRPTTVLSNDCGCNMTLTYKTKKSLQPVSGGGYKEA